MDVGKSLQQLRIGTLIEREAESALQAEGVKPDIPIVPEKTGAAGVGNVPLTTNVYGIQFTKQIPVYRYDVFVNATFKKSDGTAKTTDFTKKSRGDAIAMDRLQKCRSVFYVFLQTHQDFLKGAKCVYFDLQSILFSLEQLNVPAEESVKFNIPIEKLPADFLPYASCEIAIRRVTSEFQLTLGDLSCLSRDLTQVEHSLGQFLDLATSQQIMFSPNEHICFSANSNFLLNPVDHGFHESDSVYFEDNGSYLAIGAQKSVRFVEGPSQNRGRRAALVVETKKTPFHIVETMLEKAQRLVRNINALNNGDHAKLDKCLTGLYVETNHGGRQQRFFVKGIDAENAKSKTIVVNDKDITVAEYFRSKYKIQLKAPLAPLIRARGKDNSVSYFPMELCTIVDNQRLKTDQQTSKQVQEMIRKCAVAPAVLRQQNMNVFRSLHLDQQNKYISSAGLRVTEQPISILGRMIQAPTIQMGGSVTEVKTNNYTWQCQRFLIPASCDKWAAMAFLGPRDRLVEKEYMDFTGRLVSEASKKGMKMAHPVAVRVFRSDIGTMVQQLEGAAKQGIKFVFVVHSEFADDMHNHLKFCERQFQITTQALRFSTFQNIIQRGQPATVSNLVCKTNVKLGGLNHTLMIKSPGFAFVLYKAQKYASIFRAREAIGSSALIIGFGSNHPGGGIGMGSADDDLEEKGMKVAAPSVVGYSANYGLVDDFEFIGDYAFQPPLREEKVTIIREVVHRCVTNYRANRKREPKLIVIYRNGCSEGQFASVLKYEVPLIKLALKKLKCNAPVNIVVPNKLQGIRFFAKDINAQNRASDQNIKPGLVVDHTIVHPIFTEFFLTSHRALQGTSKTPKYTLLLNESKYSLEQWEAMTYALCYGHQIVQMPTSLPSPVYVAIRYAERGRKIYQRWINSVGDNVKVGYDEMTQQLRYAGTRFENIRVNA